MAVLWETRSLMYRIHCHTWNSPEIVNSAQPFYAQSCSRRQNLGSKVASQETEVFGSVWFSGTSVCHQSGAFVLMQVHAGKDPLPHPEIESGSPTMPKDCPSELPLNSS